MMMQRPPWQPKRADAAKASSGKPLDERLGVAGVVMANGIELIQAFLGLDARGVEVIPTRGGKRPPKVRLGDDFAMFAYCGECRGKGCQSCGEVASAEM